MSGFALSLTVICRLQATTLKKRKQYKYHTLWSTLRNHTKFYRLYDFGKAIPSIRRRIRKHLAMRGMPQKKVLAIIVCLLEKTSIRIGNSAYEKLYGSIGLTTLKDKHLKIDGNAVQFTFKGKKGVRHSIQIRNKRMAQLLKQCLDMPGKELFQYVAENGRRKCVDSAMVNDYIKKISEGSDFSAKDFRTWAGTVHILSAFQAMAKPASMTQAKRNIIKALDMVAGHLGNTRGVCKKYYVHPNMLSMYESGRLQTYFMKPVDEWKSGHTYHEKMLLNILEKERLAG